ncbi:hypothetical protein [Rhizorhabdus sp. FW153]|uniref:hypothetical protein n=1 Tax=Rhizorhabdus sp. FW153 TaxID=3400216 RepID=UPI003CF9FE2F
MNKQETHETARDSDMPKQVWTQPQMIEIDAVAVTLAGGAVSADQDPNQPS